MSKLHVDFKNKIVGVEMGKESGLHPLEIRKSQIRDLIPEDIYDIADCFTFDFAREVICINRPIVLEQDEEVSFHMFYPIKEIEYKGISENGKELLNRVGINSY